MISRDDLSDARAPFSGFVIIGIGWGGFAAQVPEIKAQIGAGDAAFGLAMLVSAFGMVLVNWLAPLSDRFLGRRAMVVPAFVMMAAFICAGLANSFTVFCAAMFVCAVASGTVDVVTNARTSDIEARRGRPLMNFGHATFSFAYALAAITAGLMRELGWSPDTIFMILTLVALLFGRWVAQDAGPLNAAPDAAEGRAPRQVGLVWLGGLILLAAFMSEQATEGWSALHLERSLGASAAGGATGPAILGLTMCIGRLGGQALVRWVSDLKVMALAAALSAVGALVASMAQNVSIAYFGFALLGMGVSVLVPMAYAHVGARVSEAARTQAIARISVIGYAGFFIGPPTMGALSEAYGLGASFLFVAATLLSITLLLVPGLARLAVLRGKVHA